MVLVFSEFNQNWELRSTDPGVATFSFSKSAPKEIPQQQLLQNTHKRFAPPYNGPQVPVVESGLFIFIYLSFI